MLSQGLVKKVLWTPEALTLEWLDGVRSEFPSLWLRDNCPSDRDPRSGQRLIDVADVPEDPKIAGASVEEASAVIRWINEARPASFDLLWLREHSPDSQTECFGTALKMWRDGSKLVATRDFACTNFQDFSGNLSARAVWMTRLVQDGIAFLCDVPSTADAVLEVAQCMGIVSETNYGRVFDVQFVPEPENLADSDRGLGLHTDNPYRDPVPGFQALHFLIAAPDGGESIFADGFAIASHLRDVEPALFDILCRTLVPFSFRSSNAELCSEKTIIQLSLRGRLEAMHYNNRSIGPVRLGSAEIRQFYTAYRHFALLLRDPRLQLKIKLRDGDFVAFDNRRILHGRTAFNSSRHARHLRGCYLTRDSVLSQTALLQRLARK